MGQWNLREDYNLQPRQQKSRLSLKYYHPFSFFSGSPLSIGLLGLHEVFQTSWLASHGNLLHDAFVGVCPVHLLVVPLTYGLMSLERWVVQDFSRTQN